jgi:hypothetical protein
MRKNFSLLLLVAALMTAVSFTSCSDEDVLTDPDTPTEEPEKPSEDQDSLQVVEPQAEPQVVVQEGEVYVFENAANGVAGMFRVEYTGTEKAGEKVVELLVVVKGSDFGERMSRIYLGDDADHTSYLLWNGYSLENVSKAEAMQDASQILFCLNSQSDSYMITSPHINRGLSDFGATETIFLLSDKEFVVPAMESVDVQVGEIYAFTNTSIANADGTLGKSGFFKEISVEGTAGNKVVKLKITRKKDDATGETYFLGDGADYASYLLWDGEKFINAKQADAVANAAKVIFCLSYASDNYTITSGTVNNAVKGAGATKTTFLLSDKEIVELPVIEYVNVQAGETYAFTNTSIANADGTLGKYGFFKVISVEGTAGNKVVELKITTKKDDAAGEIYFLGDDADHTSYLLWDGEKYINAKQADAVKNAAQVIFCLSSASEKYTITSGTINNAVKVAGATKTTFAKK